MAEEVYNFQTDLTKLDLNSNSYNGENALFFADCSKLAYESKGTNRVRFD